MINCACKLQRKCVLGEKKSSNVNVYKPCRIITNYKMQSSKIPTNSSAKSPVKKMIWIFYFFYQSYSMPLLEIFKSKREKPRQAHTKPSLATFHISTL